MAITGIHGVLYTTEPDAVRAIFRDVFGWKHVDAGHGWLIFALPPAELGVHPAEGPASDAGGHHQISFMCDDINATVADLRNKGIEVKDEPGAASFGVTATIVLPGGLDVLLYQPRHPTAM